MKSAHQIAIIDSELAPAERAQAMAASVATKLKHAVPRAQKPMACEAFAHHLDDEAWERIFREKFADPNYYASRLPKSSSPLAS